MFNLIVLALGIVLSYVCFEMLPIGFNIAGVYITSISIIIAVIYSNINDYEKPNTNEHLNIQIYINNIFIAMAIYSVFLYSNTLGVKCIIMFSVYLLSKLLKFYIIDKLKIKNVKTYGLIVLSFAIGFITIFLLSLISNIFNSISIGFCAGIIMYSSFDKIFPNNKNNKTLISQAFLMLVGIIIGIFITKY